MCYVYIVSLDTSNILHEYLNVTRILKIDFPTDLHSTYPKNSTRTFSIFSYTKVLLNRYRVIRGISYAETEIIHENLK